jgi:hypothetical protein
MLGREQRPHGTKPQRVDEGCLTARSRVLPSYGTRSEGLLPCSQESVTGSSLESSLIEPILS